MSIDMSDDSSSIRSIFTDTSGPDSSNTSYDDTSDFSHNPTRDAIAEGLISFIKPAIDRLDASIDAARYSQIDLQKELDYLSEDLKNIASLQNVQTVDLQPYAEIVSNISRKFTVINNVLQSTYGRLRNLMQQIDVIRKAHNMDKKKITSDDLHVASRRKD